jgi:hypothetical protein
MLAMVLNLSLFAGDGKKMEGCTQKEWFILDPA